MRIIKRSKWGEGLYTILGVDASLTSTGLALVDYISGDIIGHTTVGSTKLREGERLAHNARAFSEFVKPSWKKITHVILEDYSYGSARQSPTTIIHQAEWVGAIKYLCNQGFVGYDGGFFSTPKKVLLVAPSTLKKYLTGRGDINARLLSLEAYKRFAWEFPTDDELDAVGLAHFGRAVIFEQEGNKDWETGLIQKQKDSVIDYIKRQNGDQGKRKTKKRVGKIR